MRGARAGGSRRPFYVALLVVLVLGAGAISWAMNRTKAASVMTIDPKAAVGIKAQGHTLGSPAAPVEIVEFADFECPGCGQFATVTEPDVRERLIKTGQVRFRIFPFQVTQAHQNTIAAALAAECAADQNKFWEMHDKLFGGQADWSAMYSPGRDPRPVFDRYVKELGLDQAAFNACYDGRQHLNTIAANTEEAMRQKVAQTPTFIIGDRMLAGAQPYDAIKAVVDSVRAKGPAAPAAAPAPDSAKK
ncbi:putative oxidoreductase [Gemmatirosa kalamazoonensis]|uniref:Putative oxidoreductase n=1 Tax=Gemmatirosa kalamazoonensis TaxID=861299 RepID=W0RN51_9BACT|nr:thioredoxin domain-containing protein [Gemmatirosa kalamazoonensis]AHG91735.1 putative oxidoreductase [Gemmatirosa kalamazoonensis]